MMFRKWISREEAEKHWPGRKDKEMVEELVGYVMGMARACDRKVGAGDYFPVEEIEDWIREFFDGDLIHDRGIPEAGHDPRQSH